MGRGCSKPLQVTIPATIRAQAKDSDGLPVEGSMARRRFQRGHLFLRGKRQKVWVAKWRDDVVLPDGSVKRVRRSEVLGSTMDYKTRRLAERALEQRLAEVNSLAYKPRPTATFSEFAAKWQRDVLSQHKRSTQSADKSRIRKHLLLEFGNRYMKDITGAQPHARS